MIGAVLLAALASCTDDACEARFDSGSNGGASSGQCRDDDVPPAVANTALAEIVPHIWTGDIRVAGATSELAAAFWVPDPVGTAITTGADEVEFDLSSEDAGLWVVSGFEVVGVLSSWACEGSTCDGCEILENFRVLAGSVVVRPSEGGGWPVVVGEAAGLEASFSGVVVGWPRGDREVALDDATWRWSGPPFEFDDGSLISPRPSCHER